MDPIKQQSRCDCLWYGTVFWFLAVYCGSSAYSALAPEPNAGHWFMSGLLTILAIFFVLLSLGEYKNAISGRYRP